MASTAILNTYGDVTVVEDVLPAIEILTAEENFLLASLPKGGAVALTVETQTDTLRAPASAAVSEGGDATILESSTPVRLTNVIEHVAIPFSVTGTQRRVKHFSGEDELARQTTKALRDRLIQSHYTVMYRERTTKLREGLSILNYQSVKMFKCRKSATKSCYLKIINNGIY